MGEGNITDGMLEMFLYESSTMIEQLEAVALEKEDSEFDESDVNEMFRTMHTIKGSSAIMMYQNITHISHKLEDIFYFIRESHPENVPQKELTGHILRVCDFIKGELDKITNNQDCDGDAEPLIAEMDEFLERIKNQIAEKGEELPPENTHQEINRYYITPEPAGEGKFYAINVYFRQDTEMSNVKAYTMVYSLKEITGNILYNPSDIMMNPDSAAYILDYGFKITLQTTLEPDQIMRLIDHVAGVQNIDIHECSKEEFMHPEIENFEPENKEEEKTAGTAGSLNTNLSDGMSTADIKDASQITDADGVAVQQNEPVKKEKQTEKLLDTVMKNINKDKNPAKQTFISVNVNKMDSLMDLIGELVIAEAVVLQNPDLRVPGLNLTNFQKAAGQLSKITSELQDVIMAMRMMPLSNTFQKMKRVVHDVSAKLNKEVEFIIIGEDTEVDKNIIEHISDPIMHLVRNSLDHGVETKEERELSGKPEKAKVTLEAKNENGKVWITVSDDGRGMKRETILNKAIENGLLLGKNEKELSDKEVFNFITYPGFSTKENVTEYSGRGVGMDVVVQNVQNIGGSIEIESTEGAGTTMTLKIPLTLAIIDGIIFGVGDSTYVVATGDVKEFVKVRKDNIVIEPEGAESLMLRGDCLPILRLKQFYKLPNGFDEVEDGIMIILEHEDKRLAVFIDKLIGEQEIVVKPIPPYIKKVRGLSGCTQLGDGSISLIIDTASLMKD